MVSRGLLSRLDRRPRVRTGVGLPLLKLLPRDIQHLSWCHALQSSSSASMSVPASGQSVVGHVRSGTSQLEAGKSLHPLDGWTYVFSAN